MQLSWLKGIGPEFKYTIVRPIKNPGVNKLFLIKDKDDKEFVLKLIPESCQNDVVMREYNNLRKFHSDNILKAYDCSVISEDDTLFKLPESCRDFVGGIAIVLEYCEGGDLKSLGEDVSVETKKEFTRQIISAITLIHSHDMLHRDIKPHNIFLKMVNGRQIAVIGDFGESKLTAAADNTQTHTKTGTPQYEAPEVINGMRYSARADSYSLGMTLIEFFSPNSFDLKNWLNQANRDNRNDLDIPTAVPEAIRKCVWAMTMYSTEDRLTVAEISEFISETRELGNFNTFLSGIWRIRLNLTNVRNRIQNSVEDIIITMRTEQTFHLSIDQPDKTADNNLQSAESDLRNLQRRIDPEEFGSLLLAKATQIKARLDKYCLQIKNYLSWNNEVLNIIKVWMRNNSLKSAQDQMCEHINLHTHVSMAFLNDNNRPDERERDYYNAKVLDEKMDQMIRLVEYHGIKKRLS